MSCRRWFNSRSKNYLLDVFNVGVDFDSQEFQCRFNPLYPVVVLKFKLNLWLVCLPGRRRDTQGQIIYHLRLRRNKGCTLETCQWSPDGQFLLLLKRDTGDLARLPKRHSVLCNGGWDSQLMKHFHNYVMSPLLFKLTDHRCKYLFQEIQFKDVCQTIPPCLDPFLISSTYLLKLM